MSNKPFKIGQKVKFRAPYAHLYAAACRNLAPPLRVTAPANSEADPRKITVIDAAGKTAELYRHWLITANNAPIPKRRYGPRKKKGLD